MPQRSSWAGATLVITLAAAALTALGCGEDELSAEECRERLRAIVDEAEDAGEARPRLEGRYEHLMDNEGCRDRIDRLVARGLDRDFEEADRPETDSEGGRGRKRAGFPPAPPLPRPRTTDLRTAADRAGCVLRSFRSSSRAHTQDPSETVRYGSNPPTEGKHDQLAAADGAYIAAPPTGQLVHALEHGRGIYWFEPGASRRARGLLKALFDEDPQQMILAPNTTGMPYAVAASAWNGKPEPNGTGRLLGCPRVKMAAIDALRAFRDEHRGQGPEMIP